MKTKLIVLLTILFVFGFTTLVFADETTPATPVTEPTTEQPATETTPPTEQTTPPTEGQENTETIPEVIDEQSHEENIPEGSPTEETPIPVVEEKVLTEEEKIEQLKALVISSPVICTNKVPLSVYSTSSMFKKVAEIPTGSSFELIRDVSSGKIYLIKYQGKEGWVYSKNVVVPENPKTGEQLDNQTIEDIANKVLKFSFDNSRYIWVDLYRQRTYVFLNQGSKWVIERNFSVATGNNATPTVRGSFKIIDKKWGFYYNKTGGHVKYATRFFGSYYFHTVLLNSKGQIADGTLGKRASHGCLRTAIADAIWIQNNIGANTTVYIN